MAESLVSAQRTKRLRRNLILIPIARALNMALLGQAVLNVFWSQDIGLNVQKIFTLQVVNSVSVVVLELPSGITSDTLGRKKTLIIACILKIAAFVVYASARSFTSCCIAEFLLAAGTAAWSGTDTAILYETAVELGSSAEALDRESSNVFVSQTVEGSCAILGGFLATWGNVRLAISATTLPFVMACLVTFGLLEPSWKKNSSFPRTYEEASDDTCVEPSYALKEYVNEEPVLHSSSSSSNMESPEREDSLASQEMPNSLNTALSGRGYLNGCFQLFHNQWNLVIGVLQMSQVCEAISSSIFVSCATYTAVWFYQLLFERANMSLDKYGPSWAVLNFAVALGAFLSPIFYRRLGLFLAQSLLGVWLMFCFTVLGLWISPWVVLIGCLLNIVRGINQPMFITHLNHLLPSSCRATMGSVYSLGTRLVFSGGALILGFVSRVYNLTVACIICGVFYGGCAMIFGLVFHRMHKRWSRLVSMDMDEATM